MKLTFQLLISFPLSVIGILSFTAGLNFEFLVLGLLVGMYLIVRSFAGDKSLKSRLILTATVIVHFYAFFFQADTLSFDQSLTGFFLSQKLILNIKWFAPLSAAICLSAFWSSLFLSFYQLNRK
jgi:hypothetical protein